VEGIQQNKKKKKRGTQLIVARVWAKPDDDQLANTNDNTPARSNA
jgi:hypothetical protein